MATMLYELEKLVNDRKLNPVEGSYTSSLFDKGINRLAQKVGEEATEVVVAARGQNRPEQVGELADLFYHTLVLMTELGIKLEDVEAELKRRHK